MVVHIKQTSDNMLVQKNVVEILHSIYTFVFSTNTLYSFPTPPLRATCLVHLIRIDLVTVIMFVVEHIP